MNEFLASIPDILKKTTLFVSSYIPLFLFLIINSLDFCNNKSIYSQLGQLKILIPILMLIILSIILLRLVCKPKYTSKFEIKSEYYNSIEKTGENVISYLMTYIVPLMSSIQNGKLDFNNLIINIFLFIIIGIVYVKQDLVYLNPLLSCLTFNVFKTKEENHYIITRLSFNKIKEFEVTSCEEYRLELYRITDTTSYLRKESSN